MDQLLRKSAINLTGCALDKQEECPVSGEYTLPEYCPDVAVVLKCFAEPRIQNRQWSGEQLLLDGTVAIRTLYLDEQRRCLHSLEFSQPFSCALRGEGRVDNAGVNVELYVKYMNCRALSPRRVEVRGAVQVTARADCVVKKELVAPADDMELYTRSEIVRTTVPIGACDKLMTISEALEFDDAMPAAEMLLGGECRAYIRECKLLSGKVVVKGFVSIHQLYTDALNGEHTHTLDFSVPFSQIMDIPEAREGMIGNAYVHILSDTERCSVGPGGERTVLDVTVKLLVQVQVYREDEAALLLDAYHSSYPLTAQTEDLELRSLLETRWETAVLPMRIAIAAERWSEIIDVCVAPQEHSGKCEHSSVGVDGRMIVFVVARDMDGEIVYDEFVEEFELELPCEGNEAQVKLTVTGVKFQTTDDTLELQVKLGVAIANYICYKQACISDLHLCKETPYPKQNVTAWLYYADAGESVWDIGRTCCASPASILAENGMEDERVCDRQLVLVPVGN